MSMMTVTMILILAAFVCAVASAMGHCPLWVAVVFLIVIELLRVLPVGK